MLIREARPEDRDGIYRVHVSAVRATCASHYTAYEIESWVGNKRNESYTPPFSTCDIFVATDGEAVIGFSQLNPSMYEIEAVYVDPAYGRRGVGKRLLARAEEAARARGLRELRLAASLNAVPFYKDSGYTAHAQAKYRLSSGVSIACVPMTKVLLRV